MNRRKTTGCLLLILLSLFILSSLGYCRRSDDIELRVFSKDEGFHERNIVKPRIYVENVGWEVVKAFDFYYDFTVEPGKTPVLEKYYVAGADVSLIRESRRDYRVRFRVRNVHLKPGEAFPGKDGCVIGIHYPDWSTFNKNNDYSNPGSAEWRPTRRIDLEVIDWERGRRSRDF